MPPRPGSRHAGRFGGSKLTRPVTTRKLRAMLRHGCPRYVPRWLLTILCALFVLGHACELPAYADLVKFALPVEEDRTDGHHEHEVELSCEPLDAVAGPALVRVVPPLLHVVPISPVINPIPHWTAESFERAHKPPGRPPLFVLYAALLI